MSNFRPLNSIPIVTKNVMIINVLMLFITYVASNLGTDLNQILGLHFYEADSFKPFQIITYMFMHGDIFHLFSNMFGLFIFGRILENVWGPKRFLFYYVVCGIGAGIVQEIVWKVQMPEGMMKYAYELFVTIGASGSIFGILLAFGMLFPNTELMLLFFPVPIKAKYFIMLYCLFELTSGVFRSAGDNVAHFAHLGGALFGFFILMYWKKNRSNFY